MDGNVPLVHLLLEKGANPNLEASLGDTALMACIGDVALAELLLDNGAYLAIAFNDGVTSLHIASHWGQL